MKKINKLLLLGAVTSGFLLGGIKLANVVDQDNKITKANIVLLADETSIEEISEETPITSENETPIENEDKFTMEDVKELIAKVDTALISYIGLGSGAILTALITLIVNIRKNKSYTNSNQSNVLKATETILNEITPIIQNRILELTNSVSALFNENKELKAFMVSAIALMQENTPEARLKVLELAQKVNFDKTSEQIKATIEKQVQETKETVAKLDKIIEDRSKENEEIAVL